MSHHSTFSDRHSSLSHHDEHVDIHHVDVVHEVVHHDDFSSVRHEYETRISKLNHRISLLEEECNAERHHVSDWKGKCFKLEEEVRHHKVKNLIYLSDLCLGQMP